MGRPDSGAQARFGAQRMRVAAAFVGSAGVIDRGYALEPHLRELRAAPGFEPESNGRSDHNNSFGNYRSRR